MTSESFQRAKEQAMAGYLDPGPHHLNCAQTVLRCGLLALDEDPGLTYFASFLGGGAARMGEMCGAVSGTALVLGLWQQRLAEKGEKAPVALFEWYQDFIRRFEAEFGSVTCRGLLGCDISTAEGFRQAKKNQATKRCPEFVGWACDRLGEVLG